MNKILYHRTATGLSMLILLILFTALVSCNRQQEVDGVSAPPIAVEAYHVVPEAFILEVKATGELLPMEETDIRAAVGGHVMKIHFREGQVTRQGDLLVELDSRRWQAQRKGLVARFESAQSELRRRNALLQAEGISEADVEQTRAEVATLQSQIAELDVLIDLSRIRAPFSGTLGMRDFSAGAYLREGDLITRIVQTERLRVSFSVPARYHKKLTTGLSIAVASSSGGDDAVATLYAIDPLISSTSRSIEARALIDNRDRRFTAGDFVTVVLAVQQNDNAMLIPAEAIVPELNRQIVYVVEGGRAVRREVLTGARTAGRIQVIEGIHPGDRVITTGLMVLREGAEITVRNGNREVAP